MAKEDHIIGVTVFVVIFVLILTCAAREERERIPWLGHSTEHWRNGGGEGLLLLPGESVVIEIPLPWPFEIAEPELEAEEIEL